MHFFVPLKTYMESMSYKLPDDFHQKQQINVPKKHQIKHSLTAIIADFPTTDTPALGDYLSKLILQV